MEDFNSWTWERGQQQQQQQQQRRVLLSLPSPPRPSLSILARIEDGDAGGSRQVGGKRRTSCAQGLPLEILVATAVRRRTLRQCLRGRDPPETTTKEFHTNDYGKRTALYDPRAWKIRLLGRLRLDFEFAPGVGDTAAARKKQWRRLIKPVRETNISTRLYAKGSYKEVHGQKTWNKDGEPGSNGEPVLTMKRL